MDSAQTTANRKEKKGITRVWAKVKASFGSKPKSPSSILAVGNNGTSAAPTTQPGTDPVADNIQRLDQPEVTGAPVASASQEPTQPVQTDPAFRETEVESTNPQTNMYPTANIIEVDEDESEPSQSSPEPRRQHQLTASTDAITRNYLKAQAIFDKYNLVLDPEDWQKPAPSQPYAERVERKARIRVRYSCHKCKNTFGRDRSCLKCQHKRCADCVRYPARKPVDPAVVHKTKQKPVVPAADLPVPKTGECHECKTEFKIGDKTCSTCKHQVCERCLKETVLDDPATAPPTLQPLAT